MALFKNTAEIKEFLPVASTFQFVDIKPKIVQVERDIITEIVGYDLLTDISDKYNTSATLTDIEIKLLAAIREPLINIAFQLYIPQGSVQINSTGIQIATTDKLKTAFDWQISELRKSFIDSGYSALDSLILFLEKNLNSFPLYTNSDERKELKNLFIFTAKDFNNNFDITITRYTLLKIKSIMNRIENDSIKPLISDSLFDQLKDQSLNNNLTPENIKLIDYIKKIITQLTIQKASATLPLEITDTGIMFNAAASISQKERKAPASGSQLSKLETQCEAEGKNYIKQLQDFLYTNADTYPLFKNSASYKPENPSVFTNDQNSNIYAVL